MISDIQSAANWLNSQPRIVKVGLDILLVVAGGAMIAGGISAGVAGVGTGPVEVIILPVAAEDIVLGHGVVVFGVALIIAGIYG